MGSRRRQLTLRGLMWLIGFLCCLFGVLGVALSLALFLVGVSVIGPVAAADPKKRISVALWVAAAYPYLLLLFAYANWLIVSSTLGRWPRSGEDPEAILVVASTLLTAQLVWLCAFPFVAIALLVLLADSLYGVVWRLRRGAASGAVRLTVQAALAAFSWLGLAVMAKYNLMEYHTVALFGYD